MCQFYPSCSHINISDTVQDTESQAFTIWALHGDFSVDWYLSACFFCFICRFLVFRACKDEPLAGPSQWTHSSLCPDDGGRRPEWTWRCFIKCLKRISSKTCAMPLRTTRGKQSCVTPAQVTWIRFLPHHVVNAALAIHFLSKYVLFTGVTQNKIK